MKGISLVIGFLIIVHGVLFSQSCLPEGIRFSSQEQIDNFQLNYPGCNEIKGNVTISGEDIINLSELSVLTISSNASLRSFSGMDYIDAPSIDDLCK